MMRAIPATEEAVRAVYGENPPTRTLRAATAFERDGKVVACGGLYAQGADLVLFIDGDLDAMAKAPVTFLKAARRMMEIARAKAMPVYSYASEKREASERFLERLGFSRVEGRVYRWQISA